MTSVPPTQPPAAPETDVSARLADYEREWLWNEATDDNLAGYGIHMSQMLYRLPRDGQTRDMQASVESMVADLAALLERVRVVEGERDAARASQRETWKYVCEIAQAIGIDPDDVHPMDAVDRLTARAESAEAAHAALVKVLDEYFDFDVDPWEDHDAACPAPEDAWRLHRDLKAALAGGAR